MATKLFTIAYENIVIDWKSIKATERRGCAAVDHFEYCEHVTIYASDRIWISTGGINLFTKKKWNGCVADVISEMRCN